MDLLLGVLVGLALARAHAWLVYRAASRALEGPQASVRALVGFALRVAGPAAGLFALALLSPAALVGGALAFLVGQKLACSRVARIDPDSP